MARVLISDFDGTMTRQDFYQLVRARWWRQGDADPWQDYLEGRITHFEALNQFFSRVRGDEASVRKFVEEMELDPTLPDALQRIADAGWRIVIASAGCEWYIRQLLAEVKVPLEIHSNPGRYDPNSGLQMIPPVKSPFYSHQTGIDKVAIVRHELARNECVAFAGDGPPDLPAAKLVAPDRRFARSWLAQALEEQGESYRPFATWTELVDQLIESPKS